MSAPCKLCGGSWKGKPYAEGCAHVPDAPPEPEVFDYNRCGERLFAADGDGVGMFVHPTREGAIALWKAEWTRRRDEQRSAERAPDPAPRALPTSWTDKRAAIKAARDAWNHAIESRLGLGKTLLVSNPPADGSGWPVYTSDSGVDTRYYRRPWRFAGYHESQVEFCKTLSAALDEEAPADAPRAAAGNWSSLASCCAKPSIASAAYYHDAWHLHCRACGRMTEG